MVFLSLAAPAAHRCVIFLRHLPEAELGIDAGGRVEVLTAPVAEDVPGDLWRTPNDEPNAPDICVVMTRASKEGAPPKREAPEPKELLARFSIIRLPATGRADPADHAPEHLKAMDDGGRWRVDPP